MTIPLIYLLPCGILALIIALPFTSKRFRHWIGDMLTSESADDMRDKGQG